MKHLDKRTIVALWLKLAMEKDPVRVKRMIDKFEQHDLSDPKLDKIKTEVSFRKRQGQG